MRRSGAKIIIKPRRVKEPSEQPSEADTEPEIDPPVASVDEDGDDDDDDEGGEGAAPTESDVDVADEADEANKDKDDAGGGAESDAGSGAEEPAPVVRGRGRGRPRGSGRGSYVGTGRPRGRPRGSGRGRGRPRGRSGVTLRIPRRGADSGGEEGEADDSRAATDDGDFAETSRYRRAGAASVADGMAIEGDAYVTDDDPKGDEKIDANGNLLGGRQFKASTFILPGRHPERKYMLAIDAARTSGFRDSLYYFRRNLLAYKLGATQTEKDFLIEQGKLGGHLRTRSVTLVTARSAFKLHGAKMLIGGRIGVDDYYEEKAVAEAAERGLKAGDLASELIEQQQQAAADASAAAAAAKAAGAGNKGERSGLGLYRPGGPTTVFGGSGMGPFSDGPLNVAKKAMLNRESVNEENWMLVMAQRTSEANSEWARGRAEAVHGRQNATLIRTKTAEEDNESEEERARRARRREGDTAYGVYEPHSAVLHYESNTQPTRARWEALPERGRVLGGSKVGGGAWGLAWVDTVMELVPRRGSNEWEDEQTRQREALLRAAGVDLDTLQTQRQTQEQVANA